MHIEKDWVGASLLWLTFMSVCGVFAARIATLVHRQRSAERSLRMQLAMTIGRAGRESNRPRREPS